MATYLDAFKRTKNNLERRYNAKTFNVTAVIEDRDTIREGGDLLIQPDDVLVIGTIPGGSLVKGMTVLVKEAFNGTTPLFDFHFSADFPTLALTEIATGVDVSSTNANKAIHIDLPTGGAVNGNSLWLGDTDKTSDYYIVATYKGATESTAGEINVLMDYDRFATNEGAY
ncbi:MAG: hypothetical protein DRG30_09480 [Epsilonproteobacteria bacterium]|nr:MAG: hypothetical protein DRG30_09480 [Campylobacterota bacterium]